ncbi:hypothetical protein [Edaphocola aurantiacus]|uniref:hypothetical protein n=1 Tax=Edaphocola aurantiacus TaxID=2601682 RepID=UPI001C9785A7|nr:hypothetical protein [Edaphocola aurantiacus]
MGLKVSTIASIPENVERSYYLYILDYYNWDEPISKTLRNSFDKIAEFAAENDSVAIQGIPESHFYSELMSWKAVNGINPEDLLPALMITTIHPRYFLDRHNVPDENENIPEDKLVFIELRKTCKEPQDVIKIIEKIFKDIKERKEIKDFKVKKELKAGVGKILNDTIILEPNIAGLGINFNNIFRFLSRK